MGLTWRATPPSQEQAFEAMHAAIKNGSTSQTPFSVLFYPGLFNYTFHVRILTNLIILGNAWNGGEFYGNPDYNSLVLVERYLEKYPEDADKIVLSIKGGMNPATHKSDGSPGKFEQTWKIYR